MERNKQIKKVGNEKKLDYEKRRRKAIRTEEKRENRGKQ
jgi:hypothetical protein